MISSRLVAFLAAFIIFLSASDKAHAERYGWAWTASFNFGTTGPLESPEDLCRGIRAGLSYLYYQGTLFTHLDYEGPDKARCFDFYDQPIIGTYRPDPVEDFPITRACYLFNDLGGYSIANTRLCIPPTCPCINIGGGGVSTEVGDPITLPDAVQTERVSDWTSPIDPRFDVRRTYRSDRWSEGILATNWYSNGHFAHAGPWRNNFEDIFYYAGADSVLYTWRGDVVGFPGLSTTVKNQAENGYPYTVIEIPNPSGRRFVIEDGTGLRMHFRAGGQRGLLYGLEWADGYVINLTRQVTPPGGTGYNRLLAIQDNRGQRAQFTWSNTAIPGMSRWIVTRIDIDTDYNGVSFAPDQAITYDYEPNTAAWALPRLDEVSLLDLASVTTTIIAAYDYLTDQQMTPPALTTIYDGVTDSLGQLIPRTMVSYHPYTGQTEWSSGSGGVNLHSVVVNRPGIANPVQSVTVTGPLGHVSEYEFEVVNGVNRLATLIGLPTPDVLGTTMSLDFTPNLGAPAGYVYARTEPNGAVTTYERNSRGLVTTKTDDTGGPAERETTYTWHATLRLPLTRTTELMEETFSYDANGLLLSYSREDVLTGSPNFGETRAWTYSYTTLGSGLKVLSSINGPGTGGVTDITTFTYTAAGRLLTITDPNGLVTEILTYDALGRPSEVVDEQGFQWDLSYDVEGRMTEAVFAPGTAAEETLSFTFDVAGQMLTATDAQNRTWTYEYDTARRLVEIIAPAGETITYDHDDMGNITGTTYSDLASITTYVADSSYDELGRLLQDLGSNGQVTEFAYDVENNLTGVTDSFSLTTAYEWDPLNRMVELTDRANYTETYDYDEGDNRTLFEDGRALDTTFAYNGFSEVVEEVSPDRGTITYTYNSRGLVESITDGRGVVTDYAYDHGGRLTAKTFPSQPAMDQSFTYHSNPAAPWNLGTMATATDASGTTGFSRDPDTGELAVETRVMGGVSYPIGYDWAERGELASTTYPSGAVVTRGYDANGNLGSLIWTGIDPGTGLPLSPEDVVTDMAYAPFGDVTLMVYGDAGIFAADYDSSYRLESMTDDIGITPLRDVAYDWTTNDDLYSVTDALTPALDEAYAYAPRQELAEATGPWGTETYEYDGVGNRIERELTFASTTVTDTYTYSLTSNRLDQIALGAGGTRTLTHDAAGNVTGDSQSGATYTYTYDAAGRMDSLTLNAALEAEYSYNFLGQQVVRTITTSGDVIHAVHDSDGNRIAEYLYDPGLSTSILIREYIWADGRIVGVFEGGELYFVRTDHIGGPVFATDDTGAIVWTASYLPFGGVLVSTGAPIDLRFPGQWFQSESGLHQNWMRDYDPTTGRYLQADPLGLIDGATVYGYARQSPLVWTDPRGLFWSEIGSFFQGAHDAGSGLLSCWTGGCFDRRAYRIMEEFVYQLSSNEEFRLCMASYISEIRTEQFFYVGGRYLGVAMPTALAFIATRGQSDRISRYARGSSMLALSVQANVGSLSSFINQHGDPSYAELSQLILFGRVVADDIPCECIP